MLFMLDFLNAESKVFNKARGIVVTPRLVDRRAHLAAQCRFGRTNTAE